ncbi:camp-binding domain-like protein [Rhizoclosmatium globosum]|uniref:Camp-binding domain-like protein n=1 Tax=Rhizoclosmatium globosum TaxID=329046 RepID=A0A1Y2CNT6_9FUNG|nr:camp-binding domain-like protein [Rhizoclosmatium globosum]|eukprot:ORY48514.1 camp-binding domain-like protein [Rhizoclosmatium globosum]
MFVGYISSAAVSLNPSGRLYNQKMEELLDYVEWKKLSNVTKDKLISYYETKYRGKYFEEDNLLADMNESLRTKVPFLRRFEDDGRDEIFFNRIATVLHARYYIAGDFITQQGDSGLDMFFIVSGKLNVFVNNHKVVSLYDGAYIGEVALISKVLRTATVQAAMPSVLYRLTYSDFHTVINEFPDMKLRIDKLAREGKKMVREAEEGVFSKYK